MSGMRAIEYRAHLKSDSWDFIRKQASTRSGGLCELCERAAAETHHIRYPKYLASDAAGNVLHVCRICHRKLHGALTVIQEENEMRKELVDTFNGHKMTVFFDERDNPWASGDAWLRGIHCPSDLRPRMMSLVETNVLRLEKEDGEAYSGVKPDGERWYRWPAIEEALDAWAQSVNSSKVQERMTDSQELLYRVYRLVKKWGRELKEKAIAQRLRGNGTAVQGGELSEALTALAKLCGAGFQKQELINHQHDERISTIEAVSLKDPDEFVDVKSRFAEVGRATDITVPGTKLTEAQWVGIHLTKVMGAETGKSRMARLEGCSQVREVNTYRRRDIDAAVRQIPRH